MPPFSLCFDHPNKAVVLSVRGSMSLKVSIVILCRSHSLDIISLRMP